MENRKYTCNYCKKEYIPKRRRVQKFCSSSCRVNSHNLKKKNTSKDLLLPNKKELTKKQKVEAMSFAGVGNAAVGALAADAIKSLLTNEDSKPATKADFKKMLTRLKRFQLIRNMNPNMYGKKAYFDSVMQVIVYK